MARRLLLFSMRSRPRPPGGGVNCPQFARQIFDRPEGLELGYRLPEFQRGAVA